MPKSSDITRSLNFQLSQDGRILKMNHSASSLWPEALGQDFFEAIAHEDLMLKKGFDKVKITGKLWQGILFPFADKSVDVFFLPEKDGTVNVELTEQGTFEPPHINRIDPLPIIVEEKIKFLMHTSHALRTPVTIIKSGLQLLQDEDLKKEDHDLVKSLLAETEKFRSILEKILWMSRVDIGVPLRLGKINLKDFLPEFIDKFGYGYKRRIEIECHCDKPEVLGEEGAVKEIMGNLLENAFKFCPKGEVKIRIDDGEAVKITVKDHGRGIHKNERETLFKPFYTNKKHNDNGSGIGLSVVKKLVEMQGGEVGLGDPKKGAEIFFTLPRVK